MSTIPVGPEGDALPSVKGGRERIAAAIWSFDRSLLLMVWVAPSAVAMARRLGRRSMAIIVFTPSAFAAYFREVSRWNFAAVLHVGGLTIMALRPTPPRPNTAMLSSGWGLMMFTTAQAPVWTSVIEVGVSTHIRSTQ